MSPVNDFNFIAVNTFDHRKYPSFKFAPDMADRTWPDKQLKKAPLWCSVDILDGNQALIDPMTISKKLRFWDLLLICGF